jgi:hypothetical protein
MLMDFTPLAAANWIAETPTMLFAAFWMMTSPK